MKKLLKLAFLFLLLNPMLSGAVEVLILAPYEGTSPGPDAGTTYIQNLKTEFESRPGVNVTYNRGALGGRDCPAPIQGVGGTTPISSCTSWNPPPLTLDDITGYDIVVAMSIYDTPRAADIETLRQGVINKTSSAFLFFFDTCCSTFNGAPWTNAADNLMQMINTAANGQFTAAIDSRQRFVTSNPLNTSNPYAGDFIAAGSPPFYGQWWSAFKVPPDYVLYKAGTDVDRTAAPGCHSTANCELNQSAIPPDLAYGALVPQSISPGACTFVTTDTSGFDNLNQPTTYSWNQGRLAPGFIAATTSLGGMWNSLPIQTEYDASTLAKVNQVLALESTQMGGWRGDIVAYDAPGATLSGTVNWRASSKLAAVAPTSRKIFTTDGSAGKAFGASLSAAYKTTLADSISPSLPNSVNANDLVDYLRGDRSKEGAPFRKRTHLVGPVYNSRFALDRGQDYGWSTLPAAAGGTAYTTYLTSKKNRPPTLFVGTGDGMVHAFNALPTGGDEHFAYVPKGLIGKLKSFADPLYSKTYQIDAPVALQDIFSRGQWRTVLLGTLGADAQGVFALDVTNPGSFGASQVLWDRTNTDAGFNDPSIGLGVMYDPPVVSRLADGHNVAIFGNGFTGTGDTAPSGRKAALYVVDMANGNVIRTIAVGSAFTGTGANANSNPDNQTTGLGAVTLVAGADGHSVAYAYAGDFRGNLWRFDLTSATPASWSGSLVAKATSTSGTFQPILTAPEVAAHPDGGRILYFGTGRRRALTNDETDTSAQSFYAVRDVGSSTAITRSDLASRTINSTTTADFRGNAREVIGIDAPPFSWNDASGWVLDLHADSAKPSERVLFSPNLVLGQVVFTTATPIAKPCESAVTNRQYSLSAFSGRPVLNDIAIQIDGAAACTGGKSCAGVEIGGRVPVGVDPRFGKTPQDKDCGTTGKGACEIDSCPTGKPVTSNGVATVCAKDGISRWFQLR